MNVNYPQNNAKVNKDDSSGCQASLDKNVKCGETRSLGILKEFHQLYEDKVKKIEDNCTCTSSQMKIGMLNDWVRDLTEQNTLLVQVVEELEEEASERVILLEEKLRQSSKTSYEIMKTLQGYDVQTITDQTNAVRKLKYYQSDLNNVLEFIRRIRDDGLYSMEGLHFYNIEHGDLFGNLQCNAGTLSKREIDDTIENLKSELAISQEKLEEYESEMRRRDQIIEEQHHQIKNLNVVIEQCVNNLPDRERFIEEVHELRSQLKIKTEDYNRLEQSTKDMREALTAEVADKHDNIVALRRECQVLEEQCRQADKQTHFKDDIIKEMRKEIKQLRTKLDNDNGNEDEEVKRKIDELEQENSALRKTISESKAELESMRQLVDNYSRENEEFLTCFLSYKKEFENKYNEAEFDREEIMKLHFLTSLKIKKLEENMQKHWNKNRILLDQILVLNTENREQHEMIDILKNKVNTQIYLEDGSVTSQEYSSLPGEPYTSKPVNLEQTVCFLKADINKMISWRDDQEVSALKKRVEEVENVLLDSESKDQMIKNKDEMIQIQNDTFSFAQKELQELRKKVSDLEEDREIKLQEIGNLQQALKLNLNTIEELEKAMKNTEEKANNMQQAENIRQLSYANAVFENTITYLKCEMAELSKQLQELQELLKITNISENDASLSESLATIREHAKSLENQLKLTQEQVSQEIKLNETKTATIEELEHILKTKTEKLLQSEQEMKEIKSKLDSSNRESKEYKKKIKEMEEQKIKYEEQSEQESEECRNELCTVNANLINLKHKMQTLNELLNEKSEEILKLHIEISSKVDAITNLKTENEVLKRKVQEESVYAKQSITTLERQLEIYKSNWSETTDKYNKCNLELKEVKERESRFQQEFDDLHKLLKDKTMNKEVRLNDVVIGLKKEIENYHIWLNDKDNQIKNLTGVQEENVSLKEEINQLIRLKNRMVTENQKLLDQISKLSLNVSQNEERNRIISQQLEECLRELSILQTAKDKIEERNMQLEMERETLQRTFNELNQEIRYKNESVVNLEQELTETKSSRDEICAESRIVVNNVRSWLQEHKRINAELNIELKEKKLIISDLNAERNLLLRNIKKVFEKYNALSEELQLCKQDFMGQSQRASRASPPMKRSIYTWGSQGSMSYESQDDAAVYVEHPTYEYEETYADSENVPCPLTWMRRMQSMSDELQRTNEYWQYKLQSGVKKIKPVKDISSKKSFKK